jgi:hypothetical protein
MRADAEKFIGVLRPDARHAGWLAFLTWRLGFRGPYIIRAHTVDELCAKLRRLDPTVRFQQRQQQNLGGRKENENAPVR